MAAVGGEQQVTELPQRFDVYPNQITQWKSALLERSVDLFGGCEPKEPVIDVKALRAKTGELTLENDFFRRRAHQGRVAERKTIIDCKHKLPITRQVTLLNISRSMYTGYCEDGQRG